MSRIAVFPGSFDPITTGHESIILRALPLFDKIIIAIGENSTKKNYFNATKRYGLIKKVFAGEKKIDVKTYKGLTIDFCKTVGANYILRGLRTSADFEFERVIAQMNRTMEEKIETICTAESEFTGPAAISRIGVKRAALQAIVFVVFSKRI